MKTLRALGVAGLIGLTGCVLVRTTAPLGTGGAGINLVDAERTCKNSARARGWRDLDRVEAVEVTGPTTVRLRISRTGWLHADAYCDYDVVTGAASVS
jgi:hypothetical protein